jgi:MFS family permease
MGTTRNYKWELLALLSAAFFFHQADRAIFGVVLPSIKGDLGLTDSQLGLIGTCLFATLAVMVPIAGYLGDRLSRKWIITCSLLFWSAATAVTGSARGLASLILFRSVATGGGESFYAPSAYSLLAAYHKATRSLALSLHQAALYIGVMSSGFLAGWVAEHWGWRSAFYVFGLTGVLLGWVFIFRLRDAPQSEGRSDVMAVVKPGFGEALRVLARTPSALLATAGFCAVVFVNNAYVVWAPAFVQHKFSLTLTQAGGGAMFYHHAAAFAAIMLGGFLTDRLVPACPSIRLRLQGVSLLLGAPMICWLGRTGQLGTTWVAMAAFGFFRGLFEANTHASLFDVVQPKYRATAVGLMTMTAFLLGSVSPWMMGRLCDVYGKAHGMTIGFTVLSAAYVVGAVAIFCSLLFTFRRDRVVE